MSEKYWAKKDGARLQKNSGRGQYSKGDSRWRGYTVDYKEVGKSFAINEKVWAKICADAFKNGDEPVIQIIIDGKIRLALIDWERLEELESEPELMPEPNIICEDCGGEGHNRVHYDRT